MTKTLTRTLTVAGILALLATGAFAQGWGRGQGWARGQGWRAGGICPGGYAGGWQERLQSVDDPALVARITDLHNRIREAQWNLRAAAALGEDTTDLQAQVDALRADLKAANEEAGLCTGAGPNAYGLNGGVGAGPGYGMGYGRGYGRNNNGGGPYGSEPGSGMGYGRGTGVCPYGYEPGSRMGYGRGNGYGMGYGRGYGRGNGWGRGARW